MRRILSLCLTILAVSALSSWAADGKAAYDKDCAKCHGADGKGETKMGKKLGAKDYTDAKVQSALTDEQAVKAAGKIKFVPAMRDGKNVDYRGTVKVTFTLLKHQP